MLNGKQRRALRALGHQLTPVIQVGREGVSERLVEAVESALSDHELIKLKVGEASPLDRHEAAVALGEATGAEVAQVLGRTVLLYKRHPEDPKIALPDLPLPARSAQPQVKPQKARKSGPSRLHRPGARRR